MTTPLRETLAGAGLTPSEEDALTLLFADGLTQEEIGARRGWERNTTAEYIKRGKRKLRAHFLKHFRHEQRVADLKAGLSGTERESETGD